MSVSLKWSRRYISSVEPTELAQPLLAQEQERPALAAEITRRRGGGLAEKSAISDQDTCGPRRCVSAGASGRACRGSVAQLLGKRSRRRRSTARRLQLEDDQPFLGHLAHRPRRALAGVAGVLDTAVGHLVGAERRRLVDGDPAELERSGARIAVCTVAVKIPAWSP